MSSNSSTQANVNASAARSTGGLGSGIDLENLDRKVRPQDDFYRYVNGTWLQATQIPVDRSEVSVFSRLDDAQQEALRALVEDSAQSAATSADANRRKIGELF